MSDQSITTYFALSGHDRATAQSLSLQKRYSCAPDGTPVASERPHPTYFQVSSYPARTIEELGTALTATSQYTNAAVTWSDPTPVDAQTNQPHDFGWFRRKGNMVTTAKSWIALDLDEIPVTIQPQVQQIPLTDLGALDRVLRPFFPPHFHNVQAIIQATPSHGIKGCRLRWWFMMGGPIAKHEIDTLLSGSQLPFDKAVFSTGQPIYLGAPALQDLADPMGAAPRLVYSHPQGQGLPAVILPFLPLAPPERPVNSENALATAQLAPEHRTRVLSALRHLNDGGCLSASGTGTYNLYVLPVSLALLNAFGPEHAEELLNEAGTPITESGFRSGFWRSLVGSTSSVDPTRQSRYSEATIFHLARKVVSGAGQAWSDPYPELNPKFQQQREQALAQLASLTQKYAEPLPFQGGEGDASLFSAPTLTLDEMYGRLVFINGQAKGTLVADAKTGDIRPTENAKLFYASSLKTIENESPQGIGVPPGNHNHTPIITPPKTKSAPTPALQVWLADRNPARKRITASAVTWRPGAPILTRDPKGLPAFNTYRPPKAYPIPDVTMFNDAIEPFLVHVDWLFNGDHQSRDRFICWLAHAYQHPGDLPSTAWLFVTHQTGVGRTSLFRLLAKVFNGNARAGVNLTSLLEADFNEDISRCVLAMVNEVSEGISGHDRQRKADRLKDMIDTPERRINGKYEIPVREFNCCRWVFASNHINALPLDKNDRRIIVIQNPTKKPSREHLEAFHEAMKSDEFIGAVQHYLATLPLEGFNPNEEAHVTSAKEQMIQLQSSDMAALCEDFANEWPSPIATYRQLAGFIQRQTGEHNPPSRERLRHFFAEAGIAQTSRRLRIGGERTALILLNGGDDKWTHSAIKEERISNDEIRAELQRAETTFSKKYGAQSQNVAQLKQHFVFPNTVQSPPPPLQFNKKA